MICAKRKVLYILLLAAVILLGLSLVLFIGCGNNDDNGSRGGETSGPKDPIPPVAVITVTLDARGGGSYDALKYTTAALVLPVPQRENFEFTGWFESADCSGTAVSSSAYVPSRNVTLYAGWAKETMPPTPPDPPDPERYAWHDDSFDKNGIGDAAVFTANNGNYSTLKYCVSETDDSAAVYKLSEYNTISFEYSPGAAAEHNTDFSVLRLAVKNAAGEVFRFAIANKNNSVVFDKDGLNIAGSGFVNGNHGVGEWGSGEEWYSVECSLAANNVIITVDGDPYTWDYTQGMDLSGELEWYFETEFCLPSIRNIVFSEVDIRDMPEPAFKHNGYDKTSENGEDVYTASTVDLRAADLPKPDGVVNTFEFSVRPNVLPDGCWDQNYVAFAACFDNYSLLFQFLNYYKLIWVRPFENNATGNAIVEARYVDAN